MKRPHENEEDSIEVKHSPQKAPSAPAPQQAISSLQETLINKIVSSFKSQESLDFYLLMIKWDHIKELLREAWRVQQQNPMVIARKKLCRIEIVTHYMDRRETPTGVLSQMMRTHTTPLTNPTPDFMEFILQKFQLRAVPSKAHRTPKFLLY